LPTSTPYPYRHPHGKANTWFIITPKDRERRKVLDKVNVINANKSGMTGKCYSTQNGVCDFPHSLSNSGYELFYHGTNHGSAEIILEDGIDLNRGEREKDFSSRDGFYVGRDFDEALDAKWARNRPPVSALIVFRVKKTELETRASLNLQRDEYQWKEVVREFRSGEPDKRFRRRLRQYEYIEGPMSPITGENKSSTNPTPIAGSYQLCVRHRDCANLFDRSIHSVIFFEP